MKALTFFLLCILVSSSASANIFCGSFAPPLETKSIEQCVLYLTNYHTFRCENEIAEVIDCDIIKEAWCFFEDFPPRIGEGGAPPIGVSKKIQCNTYKGSQMKVYFIHPEESSDSLEEIDIEELYVDH